MRLNSHFTVGHPKSTKVAILSNYKSISCLFKVKIFLSQFCMGEERIVLYENGRNFQYVASLTGAQKSKKMSFFIVGNDEIRSVKN